jgi:hypothetical protein
MARNGNIRCLNGACKRTVDYQVDRLPLGCPWSRAGWCLVCTECGAAGSVHIVPNWHDMSRHRMPFRKGWSN